MNGNSAHLSRLGLKGQYWRFRTEESQQVLLNAVRRTLAHRALVVYASTAFDTFAELYERTETKTMVENCSYVRIDRLNQHESWNFNSPGTRGVASSKPTQVSDPPLPEQLSELTARVNQRGEPLGKR